MSPPERRKSDSLARRTDDSYEPQAGASSRSYAPMRTTALLVPSPNRSGSEDEHAGGNGNVRTGLPPDMDLRLERLLGSDVRRPESSTSELGAAAGTLLIGEREHRFYVLTPGKLEYIEANGNYVKLHSREFEYISRDTMKRLSSLLAGCGFLRIERSVLINLRAIAYVQRTQRRRYAFTLASGACLHSGAAFRDEILRALPLPHSSHSRAPASRDS